MNQQKNMRDMPDEYWKKKLSPEQYNVVRKKGTEPAFTGKFWDNHETGMYECAACGQPLFSSDAKFDSGSGWPSFDDPVNREHVELRDDSSHGMSRTEVNCKNCGAHLGHLFTDGPKALPAGPLRQSFSEASRQGTGMRYCINSCALNFRPKDDLVQRQLSASGSNPLDDKPKS